MNLIITAKCNKGCDYCFARESRNKILKDDSKTEMSLTTLNRILDKIEAGSNNRQVKLLGGEPTQHSNFLGFLEEISRRNFTTTVISNFLFKDEKILEGLKQHITRGTISGFLVNGTDLDVKNRIEIFSKNYNEIYSWLYARDEETKMSPGITFSMSEDKDANYYRDYIRFLNKHLLSIERMRTSIAFPGDKEDKDKFFFLNNKSYGLKLLTAVNELINFRQISSIDCVIYRCMFENKEEWKMLDKFMSQVKSRCTGAPFDIFPDMTVSKCYPLKESLKLNLENYDSAHVAMSEMESRYDIMKTMVDYPEDCKNCRWFGNECEGPCLGCFDLSSIEMGVNI